MAVASIAVPPDAKRDARAAELVASVAIWPGVTLRQPYGSFEAGSRFRQATGSHGERYLVNAVVCECQDYRTGHICKHIRAFVRFEADRLADVTHDDLATEAEIDAECAGIAADHEAAADAERRRRSAETFERLFPANDFD